MGLQVDKYVAIRSKANRQRGAEVEDLRSRAITLLKKIEAGHGAKQLKSA